MLKVSCICAIKSIKKNFLKNKIDFICNQKGKTSSNGYKRKNNF